MIYNAGVSEVELLKKKICGISPATVYRHFSNLHEKGTTVRKLGSDRKSYKTKEWENELKWLLTQKISND